jgi:hypothetical protein
MEDVPAGKVELKCHFVRKEKIGEAEKKRSM